MQDLIKRIEAADGPDRELDYEIFCAAAFPNYSHRWDPKDGNNRYTSSIDAAMTLVGECDELKIMRGKRYSSAVIYKDSESFDGWAATPALALCAAALRAVMANNEG